MTTQEVVTPETLTFDDIKSWDGGMMKKQMAHPEMREAIYNVVRARSLSEVEATSAQEISPVVETVLTPEEQAAAAEIAYKAAEEVEAQRVATEAAAAEQARKAAEEVTPKKVVVDYQVKDEDGNSIGRPTHLEAATEDELRAKIIEAHIQATRAFHRLKKQKVSFKEPTPAATVVPISDVELLAFMKDLKSEDPQKQLEAVRKVNKAESDKQQAEYDKKLAEVQELRRQEQVSFMFLKRHGNDFNNCEANINLIKNYFLENELAWTLDNLEIAFHALESELAPVEAPVAPVAPANPEPAPAAPVVPTPAAVPAVQPVVTATAQVPAPVNPAPVTPRPGVNAGIIPGQNSGSRPAPAPKGLTAEEIRSWDGPTMRVKMRNPALRAQIEAFAAERNKNKK